MKVKVRGLVFVGFAAAVFAQSAFATITPNTADKKIVTSKYYVDSNFQDKSDRVTSTPAANSDDWTSTAKYPSMAVLKGVKDAVAAVGVVGDGYVDVDVGAAGTANEGKFVVTLDPNDITNSVTSTNTSSTKLVTEGAVANYAEDKTNKATSITTTNASSTTEYTSVAAVTGYAEKLDNKATSISDDPDTGNHQSGDKYPTTKAVYDFVTATAGEYQPKVTDTGDNLKVGYLGSGTGATPTWKTIRGASTGNGAVTNYVTIKEGVDGDSEPNGVYTVNLDAAQIASSISNNSGSSTKLATEGAVYTYAQPVAGSGIKVGNNGAWDNLAVNATYLTLDNTTTPGTALIGVNAATDSAAISGAATSSDTGASSLTTAYAVNAYVQGLLHGNEIPAMPTGCGTVAATGGYCALVYGLISGTAGQEGATYGLQWTVMAPDTMSAGN